jgi:hypothetical protein
MSEFAKIEHPQRSPTQCVACQGHNGPFIDLQQELPGYGYLYLCIGSEEIPGCLMQMARMADMASPAEVEKFFAREAELVGQIGELEGELEEERDQKVVSVAELRRELSKAAS